MQAVPEFDSVGGVGRGNAAKVGTYSTLVLGKGDLLDNPKQPVGNTNYKGLKAEMLYLLTDNITILQSYKHSMRLNRNIGPHFKYKQFEIEFIYAF